jgi:hypothetical protein
MGTEACRANLLQHAAVCNQLPYKDGKCFLHDARARVLHRCQPKALDPGCGLANQVSTICSALSSEHRLCFASCCYTRVLVFQSKKSSLVYTSHKHRGITQIDCGSVLV